MEAENLIVVCTTAAQMLDVSGWFKENNENFDLGVMTEDGHRKFIKNYNSFVIGIVTYEINNNEQIVYTSKIRNVDQYKPFKKISYEEWLISKSRSSIDLIQELFREHLTQKLFGEYDDECIKNN